MRFLNETNGLYKVKIEPEVNLRNSKNLEHYNHKSEKLMKNCSVRLAPSSSWPRTSGFHPGDHGFESHRRD